jgi:hypothetical protein
LQPRLRRIGIGDALAVDADRARAHVALIAEPARSVAVGQQHRITVLGEALTPVPIARADHAGRVVQSRAIVQRHDRGKRALPVRTKQQRLERAAVLARYIDRLGIAGRQRDAGRSSHGDGGHKGK